MFNLKNPVSTLKIIALCLHPLMLCPEHGSVTDTPNVFGLQTTYKWRSSEVSLIFMDSKGKIIWHLIKTIWTVPLHKAFKTKDAHSVLLNCWQKLTR